MGIYVYSELIQVVGDDGQPAESLFYSLRWMEGILCDIGALDPQVREPGVFAVPYRIFGQIHTLTGVEWEPHT